MSEPTAGRTGDQQAEIERLRNLLDLAEDYVIHHKNWPLGTRIHKREELLAALKAERLLEGR